MTTISSEKKQPMSVLYALPFPRFFTQFGGIGGSVAHAHGIMKALSSAGVDLHVLAEDKPNENVEFVDHWMSLPCSHISLYHRYLWNKKFVKKIAALVSENDYSFCYMRYSTQFSPLFPALKKALGDVPLILELNSFGAQHGTLKRMLLTPLESKAVKTADLTICVSSPLLKDVGRLLGTKTTDNCFVLPNGVNPDRFPVAFERLGDRSLPASLCYCGILKPNYGLENLLEAHAELEDTFNGLSLHIIGEGPHRTTLENHPQRGNNVVFHGPVAFHKVPNLLAQMDILVYTTTPHNTFQSPIKLYEYMCTGRPITAAETPQVRQVLAGENPCGVLFDLNSKSSLIETVHQLLTDSDLVKRLAETARETVVRQHTWDQRIETLLHEMSARGILRR